MILLLGSSGNLGQSFIECFESDSITTLERAEIKKWLGKNSTREIHDKLKDLGEVSHIVLALGETDPKKLSTDLMRINCELPLNILKATANENVKVVTFGSFNEKFPSSQEDNQYMRSKKEFCNQYRFLKDINRNHLHFHIHTWYGGKSLHPHMFLGQIYTSIKHQIPFSMTDGNQLREYHHIKDDMSVILPLIKSDLTGVQEINSNNPIKLRELATSVFDYFNSAQLLRIGSLQTPPFEVYDLNFSPSPSENNGHFRVTTHGVIEYLISLGLSRVG